MRYPSRPSKRSIRNTMAWYGGETTMEAGPAKRRGPQPEGEVNKIIAKTARLLGATVHRNRRGMLPLPGGGMLPFGLGPDGYPDFVGYLPVVITPELVGQKLAVYVAIEAKTDSGVLAEHQFKVIEELRDAGAIAGVARNAEDVQGLLSVVRKR